MNELTHFDEHGASRMVDTSAKAETQREARASARVRMASPTLRRIRERDLAKGEVLSVARLAGIMAAKRTGELIPLCHPLAIESIEVDFDLPDLSPDQIGPVKLRIKAIAKISAKTGVEMEALTAVSVAALTVYDMCKAIDKTMVIDGIELIEKTGGQNQ